MIDFFSIQMYILVGVIFTGSSSFELPDLSPYFPHLPTNDNQMSKEERLCYMINLDDHTKKLKGAFVGLVFDLWKHLDQNKKQGGVVQILKLFDESKYENLNNCMSISDITIIITKHISFFDYEVIKFLTRKLGSSNIKEKLKKYVKMFRAYSSRRIVECPSGAFGDVDKMEKVYVLKTDQILEKLTVEEMRILQYKMCKILGRILIRLLRVEDGCVQFIFRGIEEEFSISKEQKQALRNLGVLSIRYGDQYIDISKGFTKECVDDYGETLVIRQSLYLLLPISLPLKKI